MDMGFSVLPNYVFLLKKKLDRIIVLVGFGGVLSFDFLTIEACGL